MVKSALAAFLSFFVFSAYGEASDMKSIILTVNSHNLEVELVNGKSAQALYDRLEVCDVEYFADDYGSFEKVGDLGFSLVREDAPVNAEPLDVILYEGHYLCIYYGRNSWNFTRLGRIRGVSAAQLKSILGNGSVKVRLSKK